MRRHRTHGPHLGELLTLRCTALGGSRRDDEAVVVCARASEVNQEDDNVLCDLADALRRLQRFDEAIGAYGRAMQRNNRSRRAANGKAQTERERKIALRKDY